MKTTNLPGENLSSRYHAFKPIRCAAALVGICALLGAFSHPAHAQLLPDTSRYAFYDGAKPLAARQAEFATRPLPAALSPIPRIACPLYIMEYHIWWRSPYGHSGRAGYIHWDIADDVDTAHGNALWMRRTHHVGYPAAGLYNSEEEGIIRWQLQCMKNAGVDGVFVQLFPDWVNGNNFVCDKIFERVLRIAGEVGIKVGVHDEVQFRDKRPAQRPEQFSKRAGDLLKKYGSDPSFLRINGRPAYAFQFWSNFEGRMTNEQLAQTLDAAEKIAGQPICWMPFHASSPSLYALPEVRGAVMTANSLFIKRKVTSFYPADESLDWAGFDKWLAPYQKVLADFPDKAIGLWGYAGFNDSPRCNANGFNWMPRRGGKTLVELLRRYVSETPRFILLSSWNDWDENTALEPGLQFDGYAGDPYLYCRILAATKGKQFVPPALPPKEAVDPWIWQPLFGIDRTPPELAAGEIGSKAAAPNIGLRVRAQGSQSVRIVIDSTATPLLGAPADSIVQIVPGQAKTIDLPDTVTALGDKPVYAALVFSASSAGTLTIRYPTPRPYVPDKEGYDEIRRDQINEAVVAVRGPCPQAGAIRLLREFSSTTPSGKITLTWNPSVRTGEIQPLVVRSVDLLHDGAARKTIARIAVGEGKDGDAAQIPWPADAMGNVLYLRAIDEAGNQSAPVIFLR
ncbi:MAG: hypothetical protein P4L33_09635 [Capsulimonadaceae bacterium]|nr:hypothetical protein [Capsulimonadaceae bacterium]